MLTAHFRLALRLRMSGGVPLLALCAFMLSTGTAFFLYWSRLSLVSIGPPDLCSSKWSLQVALYPHSSYWDFVECCLGTDSIPLICVFMFCFCWCVRFSWRITWYYAKGTQMFVLMSPAGLRNDGNGCRRECWYTPVLMFPAGLRNHGNGCGRECWYTPVLMSPVSLRNDDNGCGHECWYTSEVGMRFRWNTWCQWQKFIARSECFSYVRTENNQ
jgi:hypothetical protein